MLTRGSTFSPYIASEGRAGPLRDGGADLGGLRIGEACLSRLQEAN